MEEKDELKPRRSTKGKNTTSSGLGILGIWLSSSESTTLIVDMLIFGGGFSEGTLDENA